MKKYSILLLCSLLLSIGSQLHAQTDTLPDDFPPLEVNISTEPSDGVIYISTIQRGTPREDRPVYGQYLMVINNEGIPIEYQAVGRTFNFGRLPGGNRYYFNFERNGPGRGASSDGSYRILDRTFNVVQEYRIQGANLPTQAHEFLLRENGNVLLISQPLLIRNLSAFGGSDQSLVSEAIIQELDTQGQVVFAWRSWDHVLLTDSTRLDELQAVPPDPVSYMHVNAIAEDIDGNFIISARRFDELIKINRFSGDIMWRMGGINSRHNEFTFINDPFNGFSGQHHVQVLPNGNILLFDNAIANLEGESRAVEYSIDEEARTATLVWSYSDGRFAPAMGSVQRLPNGNTLIGWGTAQPPNVTEVTSTGEVVFALSLPDSQVSYRAYRFED